MVITNREDYIAEAERQLSNENYYEKLLENPHEKFKKDMHDTISEIQDKCALQGFENFYLSSESRTPEFYILPKTHKTKNSDLPLSYPGRPIVSACGSLTENVSAFLDGILKPHMESLPSYIKDTSDFITKIRQLPPLSEDSFLV